MADGLLASVSLAFSKCIPSRPNLFCANRIFSRYMKGLGLGPLVDKLLKCGITLADYYSLAAEDEDGDCQAMGFEDLTNMYAHSNHTVRLQSIK